MSKRKQARPVNEDVEQYFRSVLKKIAKTKGQEVAHMLDLSFNGKRTLLDKPSKASNRQQQSVSGQKEQVKNLPEVRKSMKLNLCRSVVAFGIVPL